MTALTKAPGPALAPEKFRDPEFTATGAKRARVGLDALETLWINTGTLCNLACANCYIESSPTNDALVYISAEEARAYYDEIERLGLGTREIAFTGGEPFMNPDMIAMMRDALERGFKVLVLTNAMRPMEKRADELLALNEAYGERLTVRVSLDHHRQDLHEMVRGERSWGPAIKGLKWLSENGFSIHAAARTCWNESDAEAREGFRALFAAEGVGIDCDDPVALMLLPEMDAGMDVPEITEACWGILGLTPSDIMCATSRMVVKRKGAERPVVTPCTLLPYDVDFEMGETLAQALGDISLNHPHCAKFCVLGGGACSRSA